MGSGQWVGASPTAALGVRILRASVFAAAWLVLAWNQVSRAQGGKKLKSEGKFRRLRELGVDPGHQRVLRDRLPPAAV